MGIRAILFDLDNTLTNRNLSVHAYARSLIDYYQNNLGQHTVEKVIQIIQRIDNGGYPKKDLLTHPSIGASVAYALLNELTWIKEIDFNELTQFWFEQFGKNAVAMDGAIELLKELKIKGFKLAIVSNGGHSTRMAILEGLGFTPFFDVIMSSEKAGMSKPKADIFLHTSQILNIQPNECLFVGDHPINDIQGAKSVGMHTVWMEGFHKAEFEIDQRIQHLNQLWQFV